MAKKDYLKLFVDYAKEHEVGYEINCDSALDNIYFVAFLHHNHYPPLDTKFGSKTAYDWLVRTHKKYIK